MAIDPVCHMQVDVKNAAATTVYKGKTYYFSAAGCKVAFDKDQQKYLSGDKHAGRQAHELLMASRALSIAG